MHLFFVRPLIQHEAYVYVTTDSQIHKTCSFAILWWNSKKIFAQWVSEARECATVREDNVVHIHMNVNFKCVS